MREMEFLPAWYSTLRQKRRILMMEAWLGIAIFAGLSLWMILSARNVIGKETLLNTREKQLTQSNHDLQMLAELQSLKAQMSDQVQLMAHVGPNLPMARLMDALQRMMPKEMALLDMTVELQSQARAMTGAAAAGKIQQNRQLLVTLHGVAPNDVELGNFMIRVATIPNYVEGSVSTKDVDQNGHMMRDFKISFGIDLADPQADSQVVSQTDPRG
jgi:hypothetical protein